MQKSALILVLLFLAGCGFSPLYVERESGSKWYYNAKFDTSIVEEMQQVKVEPIADRFGQQLRNNLLDSLTPKGTPKHPKYRLFVKLTSKRTYDQALRQDITATRRMVVYKVSYYMMEGTNKLFTSNSIAYTSYDILKNPYSTTVAEQKADTDAAKIIGNDIALRVGAYFHSVITKQGSTSDI